MLKGICGLSVIPMRLEPAETAEMVNQVIFGESFDVLEQRKKWLRIRLHHDRYEGWIDRKQFEALDEKQADFHAKCKKPISSDLVEIISREDTGSFFPIFLGSFLPAFSGKSAVRIGDTKFKFSGAFINKKQSREQLIEVAFQYLHAPYLWGGRSPFGIDCSGYSQMVYRICGYNIPRDASQQAQIGEALSFIEESEPGDLAFFDNSEGKIIHVGIILKDNYILHASGKVRLDRLDQSGIFHADDKVHTHRLRVIKKII